MTSPTTDPAAALAELGRIKLSEVNLDGILARVAQLAKQTLPGTTDVSVTLVRDEKAYTAAFTGKIALDLDERQYRRRNGPCLEAAVVKSTISVPDTVSERRWPEWAGAAAAAGVGSSLSIGLPIHDAVSGALNVYGAGPEAFDDDTIMLGEKFAGYAAVALANAHLYDSTATLAQHMQAAMDSRAVIEQAKGIIMGERRCTADEAFAILTKVSQDSNRKLRDVSVALVARAHQTTRQ